MISGIYIYVYNFVLMYYVRPLGGKLTGFSQLLLYQVL